MRGIVGGMFDPIHFGHYKPALELMPILGLTHIYLIPCGFPSHREPPIASAAHRWRMVQMIADGQRLIADDRELRRPGPSYTIDTLRSLLKEDTTPLCLIVGADALAGLPNWHQAEAILECCHIAAMARPDTDLEAGFTGNLASTLYG